MICPFCKENVTEDVAICPHCASSLNAENVKTAEALAAQSITDVIDGLSVSKNRKAAFLDIYENNRLKSYGLLNLKNTTYVQRWHMVSILAFIFCPFYYLFTGMWKKGLVFLLGGAALAVGSILLVTTGLLPEGIVGELLLTLIRLTPGYMAMHMAVGDQYRAKVLKEDFWL